MAVRMNLREEVNAVSHFRASREEIIDYYREEYPGSLTQRNGRVIEDWKGELAEDLQPYTANREGDPLSIASVRRRFQSGREQAPHVSKRQQEEYRALGESLPPIPPPGGYLVTGTIHIRYSKTCEVRELLGIYIVGADAELFAETADIQIVINIYNEMDADDPEGYAPCDEDANDLNVTAL